MLKQFVSIYEKDNVRIWGHIEEHTSCITGDAYNEVTHIKITKNNKLVYEAYGNALRYPFNHGDINKIDFSNIVDDIVFLINYDSKSQVYSEHQNKVVADSICLLDKLLYECSCMAEIEIRRLKREQKQAENQARYNAIQEENKALVKEAEMLASEKGLFIDDICFNPIITTVKISREDLLKYASLGEKQQKEVDAVTVKQYILEDYENDSCNTYNQSNNRMLVDIIQFLKEYNE